MGLDTLGILKEFFFKVWLLLFSIFILILISSCHANIMKFNLAPPFRGYLLHQVFAIPDISGKANKISNPFSFSLYLGSFSNNWSNEVCRCLTASS